MPRKAVGAGETLPRTLLPDQRRLRSRSRARARWRDVGDRGEADQPADDGDDRAPETHGRIDRRRPPLSVDPDDTPLGRRPRRLAGSYVASRDARLRRSDPGRAFDFQPFRLVALSSIAEL